MTTPPIRAIKERPERLFVVGDIHGCLAELGALLNVIKVEQKLSQNDLLIFIGDYIDRGPESKGVIDLMLSIKAEFPKTVFLKGNHEDMLLDYLGLGGRGSDVYMHNGGLALFRSYGVPAYDDRTKVVGQLPSEHIEFLKGLELGVSVAEFLFVHAGLDPLKPMDGQSEEDLLWIRQAFTENVHPFGKTVVFGHTPYEDIFIHLPFKLGIDTGLVYGNKLSCLELVEGVLFQIESGERTVKTTSLEHYIGSKTPDTVEKE